MKQFRYWLSALLLDWGVRLVPDDYPRLRLQWGIGMACDVMIQEMSDEFEKRESMDNGERTYDA